MLMKASSLSCLDAGCACGESLRYVSATNATIKLMDGDGRDRDYIDFVSSYGAVNFGHSNDAIEGKLKKNLDTVGGYYPFEAEEVAQWLCHRLARPDGRVYFQVGGSHAVSTAIALAQRSRRGRVAAITGGFHGLGVDSLAASSVQRGAAIQRTALSTALDSFVQVIRPGTVPETWTDICCLIYEPVQGANGYVPLDLDWLRVLELSAADAGVVTIADEVQSGFFRHGPFSPAREAGLSPNIQIFSKSLTNGMFPLAALVYDADLDARRGHDYLSHTFQMSTMGYYAAKAVAMYIDSAPIADYVAGVNAALLRFSIGLDSSAAGADIHVMGPSASFRPTQMRAADIVAHALKEGLLTFAGGAAGDRIRVAPPLTIPLTQLEIGLEALAEVAAGKTARGKTQ